VLERPDTTIDTLLEADPYDGYTVEDHHGKRVGTCGLLLLRATRPVYLEVRTRSIFRTRSRLVPWEMAAVEDDAGTITLTCERTLVERVPVFDRDEAITADLEREVRSLFGLPSELSTEADEAPRPETNGVPGPLQMGMTESRNERDAEDGQTSPPPVLAGVGDPAAAGVVRGMDNGASITSAGEHEMSPSAYDDGPTSPEYVLVGSDLREQASGEESPQEADLHEPHERQEETERVDALAADRPENATGILSRVDDGEKASGEESPAEADLGEPSERQEGTERIAATASGEARAADERPEDATGIMSRLDDDAVVLDEPTFRLGARRHALWRPLFDIVATAEEYRVLVDLPGVDPEDVSITVDGEMLTISGARAPVPEGDAHRLQRQTGRFVRRLRLGNPISAEAIEATLEQGVLELKIPRGARERARRVVLHPKATL